MKYLLTSAGITNASIRQSLVDLLGKPISESHALVIPTGAHALANAPGIVHRTISGANRDNPFVQLGWKSVGVLELTTLPTIKQEIWRAWLRDVDALLVDGGDCQYLTYWMKASGLAELLPALPPSMVYVGLSAGSMITTTYGTTFGFHTLSAETSKSLGLFPFALLPHLDHERFPENSLDNLAQEAAHIPVPTYAIDDATALQVVDGVVTVISEGNWMLFQSAP